MDLPSSPTPKAGLAAIHARHSEWVKASMLRLLSDDGEDAAQEVWLRFSRQLGQLRSVEEPVLRAVLRRIMRSVCVDILRRRGPATQPLLDDDALPERAGPQAAEVRELAANVRQRWAQLPERERTILKLHFDDGLTLRDIAALLAVPQGSVAGWYARALMQLREDLP